MRVRSAKIGPSLCRPVAGLLLKLSLASSICLDSETAIRAPVTQNNWSTCQAWGVFGVVAYLSYGVAKVVRRPVDHSHAIIVGEACDDDSFT